MRQQWYSIRRNALPTNTVSSEIDGVDEKITVKIPANVRHGEVLRVRGKGVKYSALGQGDLLIKINVVTPKKLSRKAKKALEDLANEGL